MMSIFSRISSRAPVWSSSLQKHWSGVEGEVGVNGGRGYRRVFRLRVIMSNEWA